MTEPVAEHSGQGHKPVMLDEVVQLVVDMSPARVLDCCFGGGGHTRAVLEATDAHVTAIDRDPAAAERASELKAKYGERFEFIAANYSELSDFAAESFDVVLYDLGVSSYQLDEAERGFSFRKDAALDMRMNPGDSMSAAEFLEMAPKDELVCAIKEYGEERNWKRIVETLEAARGTGILSRTVPLAQLIQDTFSPKERRLAKGRHLATKSFQGIRMAVNQELSHLRASLPAAFELLSIGGRIIVISFHSLEDRIIKRQFRSWAGQPLDINDSTPQQDRPKYGNLPFRKPLRPTEQEVAGNPRSRSALLRAFDKTHAKEEGVLL